jgi:hypothetical protein
MNGLVGIIIKAAINALFGAFKDFMIEVRKGQEQRKIGRLEQQRADDEQYKSTNQKLIEARQRIRDSLRDDGLRNPDPFQIGASVAEARRQPEAGVPPLPVPTMAPELAGSGDRAGEDVQRPASGERLPNPTTVQGD